MTSWQTKKLGDISTVITSGSRGWASYYSESGAKFIRMTNLPRDGINLLMNDLRYVQIPAGNSEGTRTKLNYKDILISITAELGKIGYVPKNIGDAYINQHVALLRIDESQAIPKMVAYSLATRDSRNKFNRRNDAGAKAGLNLTTIQNFPISLPEKPEQQRIVSVLEVWNEYIEKLEQKIALKEQLKKGLMQQYFSVTSKDEGTVELQKYIKSFTTGLNPRKNFKLGTGKNLYITIKNISDGKLNLKNAEVVDDEAISMIAKRSKLAKNDVIMSSIGNIGEAYLLKEEPVGWNINESVFCLKPDQAKVLPDYLYYLVTSEFAKRFFDNHMTGSSFKSIKMKDLKAMPIMRVSLIDQEEIVKVLQNIDEQLNIFRQQKANLFAQKKYLLKNLTTGTICTHEHLTPLTQQKESTYA